MTISSNVSTIQPSFPPGSEREAATDPAFAPLLDRRSNHAVEDILQNGNVWTRQKHSTACLADAAIAPAQTLPERLAAVLLEMNALAEDGWIEMPSIQTLADQLGIYRETTGALLQAFRRQGFVELGYRRLHVLNPESLQKLGGLKSM